MTASTPRPGTWPPQIRRVVFFATRIPEMSGGSVAIENLAQALARIGVAVEFISLFPGDGRRPGPGGRVVLEHPQWHRGPLLRGGSKNLTTMVRAAPLLVAKRMEIRQGRRRLRLLMESYGPETAVVFTHVRAKEFLDGTGYVRGARGPVLIGQHHSQFESLDDETWLRQALPTHFGDVDAFTTLTDEDAGKFSALIPVPCFGVGNPLRVGWGSLSMPRRRTAVALARFSHEKQLDLMVRSFAEATSAPGLTDWGLQIYGAGEEEPRIRAAIESTGTGDRVRLMGPTSYPELAYSRAAINLNSSSYEGFGLTILEAAACGTPSLAFDCSPGVRGLITPGTGFLVSPPGQDAYTRALRDALGDQERLTRMGRAARDAALRFCPERIVERWGTILGAAARRHDNRSPSPR